MPRTISLDKPLLEQQSVREMLTPLTEGIKKGVRMNDLLNIARAVIHFELADCGCDESELTGLKLSYAVMHPQDENVHRVYTIEWNLPQSEVAGETTETPPEVSTSSDSNPPISNQLMSKLFSRLEEARTDPDAAKARSSTLMATFKSSSTGTTLLCDPTCLTNQEGQRYKRHYIPNGIGKPLKKGECSTTVICEVGSPNWEIPIL